MIIYITSYMTMSDIIKNPIIIGLIIGVLIYLYIYWHNDKYKNKKSKLISKGNTILIPLTVGFLVALLIYSYMQFTKKKPQDVNLIQEGVSGALANNLGKNLNYNLKESSDVKSYHLISRGVNVPTNLPDVFIETIM